MKAVHALRQGTPTRLIAWCGCETRRYDGPPFRGQLKISDSLEEVTCRECRRKHRAPFKEAPDVR